MIGKTISHYPQVDHSNCQSPTLSNIINGFSCYWLNYMGNSNSTGNLSRINWNKRARDKGKPHN